MTDHELAGAAIKQAKASLDDLGKEVAENYRLKLENLELRHENESLRMKLEILMRPLR